MQGFPDCCILLANEIKRRDYEKNNMMKSAVLMMLAAMAINSCSTSKT